MKTIVLAFSLLALAAPSQAASSKSKADNETLMKHCHQTAGKEVGEGEMRSGVNRLIVQRWSDCMMGLPHAQ